MLINPLLDIIIITVVFASQLNALPSISFKPNKYHQKPYENRKASSLNQISSLILSILAKLVEGDIVVPESMLKPTNVSLSFNSFF
jgi:hypothetical protein